MQSEVARGRYGPQPCLPVREEVARPLREPVVHLHPITGQHILEADGQRTLVELDPLPAEGHRGIVKLLDDAGRGNVAVPDRHAGDGPDLYPALDGGGVAAEPGQHAGQRTLDPGRADNAHAGQYEGIVALARNRQAKVAHRAQFRFGDGPANVDARGIPERNAIEAERGAGFVLVADQIA